MEHSAGNNEFRGTFVANAGSEIFHGRTAATRIIIIVVVAVVVVVGSNTHQIDWWWSRG